jgi:hypothetical protein
MKYIALAVLLAVMQAPPPVPRKAANPSGRTGNSVDQQRQDNKNPSTQPESGIQPVGTQPNQDGSQSKAADNANKPVIIRELPSVSVTKDRLDKLYIFFTGVLIVVGSFGVRAAYMTLKAIERQADLIGRQVTLMTGQLEAMKGQLAQMESAGKQTKALIDRASDQASALRRSADALRDNARAGKVTAVAMQRAANAAKKSADAALKNIDIIKSKERARIRVVVEPWMPIVGVHGVEYTIHLDGPTPAYIVSASAMAYTDNSENPFIGIAIPGAVVLPTSPTLKQISLIWPDVNFSQPHIDAIGEGRSIVRFRGHIRYKDIFGDQHITPFGYRWNPSWLYGPYVSGEPLLGIWEQEQDSDTEAN